MCEETDLYENLTATLNQIIAKLKIKTLDSEQVAQARKTADEMELLIELLEIEPATFRAERITTVFYLTEQHLAGFDTPIEKNTVPSMYLYLLGEAHLFRKFHGAGSPF